jgi:PAS domain S-box-containing protein
MNHHETVHVLIVDDSQPVSQMIERLLQAAGYTVVGTAASGMQALEMTQALRPDVVIMDIMMPEMDGVEATQRILKCCPTPVVVLSAYDAPDLIRRATDVGVGAYLVKPASKSDLERAITIAMARFDDTMALRRLNAELEGEMVERKQAEEMLRESEQKLRRTIEQSGDGIVLADEQGTITEWNQGQEQITGLERTEALGRPVWDILFQTLSEEQKTPTVYQQWKASILEYLRTGQAPWLNQLRETEIQRPDGTRRSAQALMFPIKTDRGFMSGSISRDITERKQAEMERERLLVSEREQRRLAEALCRAAAAVNSTLDLDRVLDRILEQVNAVIPSDTVNIMLIEGGQARIVRWRGSERFGVEDHVESVIFRLADTPTLHHMQETGEAMVVPDTTAWPGWVPTPKMDWLRSYAAAPIRVRDQVIGFLNVGSATPGFFHQAHTDCLHAFANQASLAVGNAQLYEQAQARRRYLETLQQISATLRSTLPLDEVLETIARGAGEALGYVGAMIAVPNAMGERLTLRAVWGSRFLDAPIRFIGPKVESFSLPLTAEENPTVRAYLSGELQAESREPERMIVGIEPAISPKLAALTAQSTGAKLGICVPLPTGEKVVGVLVILSPQGQLSDEERAMLLGLADQAGLAIENAGLFERVHNGRDRLQTLSRRLMEVQEVERRNIARELHDEIGQALTSVKINLQAAQCRLDTPALAPLLEESISTVERTLQQVRSLSLDLRPSLLDDLGLVPALRWYVDRQAQQAGFAVRFTAAPLAKCLPPHLEIACFRIVQEALTNVVRHARAQRVSVALRQHENELQLTIRDDGVGFDAQYALACAARGESLGLLGMQERASLAGGQIEIVSTPGHGTEIRAHFPATSSPSPKERDEKGESG